MSAKFIKITEKVVFILHSSELMSLGFLFEITN